MAAAENTPAAIFRAGQLARSAELAEDEWLHARIERDISRMAEISAQVARLHAEGASLWDGYPLSAAVAAQRAETERHLASLPTVPFDPADDLFGGIADDLSPLVTKAEAAGNLSKLHAYLDGANELRAV